MDWLIKPLLLKKVLRNMGAMESYLVENCPDINYTVVKPPGLSNAAKTGMVRYLQWYIKCGTHNKMLCILVHHAGGLGMIPDGSIIAR